MYIVLPPPCGGAGAVFCAISITGPSSSSKESPCSSSPGSPPTAMPYSVLTESSGGGAGKLLCANAPKGSRAQAARVAMRLVDFISELLFSHQRRDLYDTALV